MNKFLKYFLEVYLIIGSFVFLAHFHTNNFEEALMRGVIWPVVAYEYYTEYYPPKISLENTLENN